mmetsp:Transcript_41857/g.129353  ORF Transcript_41857/g.129353 Transcript_41857/m.129353 type:complete len:204 (-) Transcript_41857:295-906(-)
MTTTDFCPTCTLGRPGDAADPSVPTPLRSSSTSFGAPPPPPGLPAFPRPFVLGEAASAVATLRKSLSKNCWWRCHSSDSSRRTRASSPVLSFRSRRFSCSSCRSRIGTFSSCCINDAPRSMSASRSSSRNLSATLRSCALSSRSRFNSERRLVISAACSAASRACCCAASAAWPLSRPVEDMFMVLPNEPIPAEPMPAMLSFV